VGFQWWQPAGLIDMLTGALNMGAGVAPSYFLEGLLCNVPNDKCGSSYEDTFVAAYNWMIQADQTQFVCANEQSYLLRDNDPVTWPTANGKQLLDELATFWRDWN